MSNLFPAALAFLFASSLTPVAAAQQEAIDAFARFVVDKSRAKEPTIPYPHASRPEQRPLRACSLQHPVCVRAAARAEPAHVRTTLEAIERAYDWIALSGWPVPRGDAGEGGGLELDVYLEPGLAELARADVDGAVPGPQPLDTASTFAQLRAGLTGDMLEACATAAVAEAGLRAQDPAEREPTARLVSDFVAYLATGVLGCGPTLSEAQADPESGIVAEAPAAHGSALLALAWASLRHDGGDGRFVREVWQLARQRSDRPGRLRVAPDFWEALDRALVNAGESLETLATELAIARYLAPRVGTPALPAMHASDAIGPVAAPPLAKLPAHLPPHSPPLALFGSAYTRIDTRGARAGERLEVWLRGELGPHFGLCAVQLDRDERELGRVCAPARRVPSAFVPVELEPRAAAVLLVVTRMPRDARELRRGARDEHTFRLILDRGPR